MRSIPKYLTLGFGHGINDCIAGFIIGNLFFLQFTPFQIGIYTILYNLIAFGGQLVVAKYLSPVFTSKKLLLISFGCLIGALVFLNTITEFAIVFSGAASAIFHVAGGVESTRKDGKSFGIGLFAAPGIVGLIIGGLLSSIQFNIHYIGIIVCLVYVILIGLFYKSSSTTEVNETNKPIIERHDIIMIIIITVISLRSFVWDIIQLTEEKNYDWLFIIAIAAASGKILGGFLSDKIGHKKYSIIALLLSIPFLTFFRKSIIAMSIGAFLLQSTIPATTIMIIRLVKHKPAMGIAFSFGLSVMVGMTLLYTPIVKYLNNEYVLLGVIIVSIAGLILYGRKRKTTIH